MSKSFDRHALDAFLILLGSVAIALCIGFAMYLLKGT